MNKYTFLFIGTAIGGSIGMAVSSHIYKKKQQDQKQKFINFADKVANGEILEGEKKNGKI